MHKGRDVSLIFINVLISLPIELASFFFFFFVSLSIFICLCLLFTTALPCPGIYQTLEQETVSQRLHKDNGRSASAFRRISKDLLKHDASAFRPLAYDISHITAYFNSFEIFPRK